MKSTRHQILFDDARKSSAYKPESVDLVFTSPPYPMIEMWDGTFASMNPAVATLLDGVNPLLAFEGMHGELDRVWNNCYDALKPGGYLVINVGDATRTIHELFRLYTNHARIIGSCSASGFVPLPAILWRKQTNAPNKFMGSGMLPAGAYVTLEHEYILIFRKGRKREFKTAAAKLQRQESALFWEERNNWYSDVWMDIKGARQQLKNQWLDASARQRSAAFPFEFAYRLVNMFSMRGDTVLDPFLGTGTTTLAAIASGRNSIGIEIEKSFGKTIEDQILKSEDFLNEYIQQRIMRHLEFVRTRMEAGKPIKHKNAYYGFPVFTAQEKNLKLFSIASVQRQTGGFQANYAEHEPVAKNSPPGRSNAVS